jgi:hypothetical protein
VCDLSRDRCYFSQQRGSLALVSRCPSRGQRIVAGQCVLVACARHSMPGPPHQVARRVHRVPSNPWEHWRVRFTDPI